MSQPLCGIIDKAFHSIALILSYINDGSNLSISKVHPNSVEITGSQRHLYGINLEFESNRVRKDITALNNIIKRLKTEDDGSLQINFIKNPKEYFVTIWSLNKNTIDSIAEIFSIAPMSGDEIVNSIAHYFLFSSYTIDKNQLIDNFKNFVGDNIENNQFHRVASLLTKNVLKNNDIYQAITYKKIKDFNVLDLFSINWNGVLSIYFNFTASKTNYALQTMHKRAKNIDSAMSNLLEKVQHEKQDYFAQDYNMMNAILICNNKKNISQIETATGFLFEENYLTGINAYKQTLLFKRDTMFDIFVKNDIASSFVQNCKKKPEFIEKRDDGSWILPDFFGQDIVKSFMNYSFGKNANPHAAIIAKTGSGKSSALLKILKSSMWIENDYSSLALEHDLIDLRYIDVDYSGGNFIDNLRKKYPNKVQAFTGDVNLMRFALLDIETEDPGNKLSPPKKNELSTVCSFINTVLEATDKKNILTNTEEDRLRYAITEVFTNPMYRVNKKIGELKEDKAYASMVDNIHKKYTNPNITINELEQEYSFLQKPTFVNVIDFISKKAKSSNINEIQRETYKSLLKKVSGLTLFNFAEYANLNIKENKNIFYIDFGEIKQNQKDFISTGWMLLSQWIKLDKIKHNERAKRNLPRRKIFYVIEESHNFFTVPSFAKLFVDTVKELRKFGIHFLFISHSISNMPEDIYKAIATKIFLFRRGDSDLVKQEIDKKAKMKDERLEVFEAAIEDDHALFIMHDKGESICNLNLTQEELKTFVPKRIE